MYLAFVAGESPDLMQENNFRFLIPWHIQIMNLIIL